MRSLLDRSFCFLRTFNQHLVSFNHIDLIHLLEGLTKPTCAQTSLLVRVSRHWMVLGLHATRLGPPRLAGEARSLKREVFFMDELSLSERGWSNPIINPYIVHQATNSAICPIQWVSILIPYSWNYESAEYIHHMYFRHIGIVRWNLHT